MASARYPIGQFARELEPVVARYASTVSEHQRPCLSACLYGLLRDPSPYLADVARSATCLGETFDAREGRLSCFMASPKIDLGAVKEVHLGVLKHLLSRRGRIPLYADLSDVSKPYARTMDALDHVRDGSDPDKKIKPGYWLNEVHVGLAHGRLAPVVFDLFSLNDKVTLSQNEVILAGMDRAFMLTGPRGLWIGDRGYDNGTIFEALLSKDRDFVIRLQAGSSSRNLLSDSGETCTVETLLPTIPVLGLLVPDKPRRGSVGVAKVRLPDHPDRPLYLVVVWGRSKEPLVVLTTLRIAGALAARRLVRRYLSRWSGAEDPIRFLKQNFRLEKFLVSSLKAMQVWVFFMGIAMTLLAVLLAPGRLRRRLLTLVEWFRGQVRFAYYRVARAVHGILTSIASRRYLRLVTGAWP